MNVIFKNSKNSKTSDPHRLLLNLTDKINLKRKHKNIALSNLSIYCTWKNIKKKSYKNIYKFKASAPTWNEEFELHDGSGNGSKMNSISRVLKIVKHLILIEFYSILQIKET